MADPNTMMDSNKQIFEGCGGDQDSGERVAAFIHERVNPGADARDREGQALPRELLQEAGSLGLLSTSLSPELGGQGWSQRRWGNATRAIAFMSDELALPFALGYQQSLARLLYNCERRDLVDRYVLPMAQGHRVGAFCWTEGASPFSFQTTIRRTNDGLIVAGRKSPISLATIGDFFVIFARDEVTSNLVSVVVERDDKGVEILPVGSLGMRALGFGEVLLHEVELPADRVLVSKDALAQAQQFLTARRVAIVSFVLGRLEALVEAVANDMASRVRYKMPLTTMQVVQARLGQMRVSLDACAAFQQTLLDQLDRQQLNPADAAWHPLSASAKYFVVEQARRVIEDAQTVLGGAWYFDGAPFGRWMRDLLGFIPAAGTQGILEVDLGLMTATGAELQATRTKRNTRS